MGLLFNDNNEINEKIKNEFGNLDNHLIAFKHNGINKGLAKLLIIGGYIIHLIQIELLSYIFQTKEFTKRK